MAAFCAQRVEWKMKKAMMVDIIANNGYIFGGAVRDWHLHEKGATAFYRAHVGKGKTNAQVDALYNDEEYMPEFGHRMVVPVDIDACIPSAYLDGLLKSWKEKRFNVVRIFSHDPAEYIPGIELQPGEVEHMRFKVFMAPKIFTMFPTPLAQELDQMLVAFAKQVEDKIQGSLKPFTIDLMVVKGQLQGLEAPFGNLDFECNGLIASKEGIKLSKHVCGGFDPMHYNGERNRILDDIMGKKAVLARHCTHEEDDRNIQARVKKMLQKGWTIVGFKSVDYVCGSSDGEKAIADEDELGHCIVCHDDIPKNNHYKMACCNGRFHLRCLVQAMTTGVSAMASTEECLMCKRHMWEPSSDLKVLQAIARFDEQVGI